MREGIHPQWFPEARIVCACGNVWMTGATVAEIRTDVCAACHPFYTGEQRIVDTEGQVDRFLKRLKVREEIIKASEVRDQQKTSTDVPLADFELGTRAEKALAEQGVLTAGDVLRLMEEGGDEALLSIKGFGQKALIDLKRRMRARGYDLPQDEAEAAEATAE